jgi:hypothetical protein
MELIVKVLAICNGIELVLILVLSLKLLRHVQTDRLPDNSGGLNMKPEQPVPSLHSTPPDTYAGSQNKKYVELWGSLQKLLLAVEDLWENVTTPRLADLLIQLRTTRRQVDEWSLFFEEEHLRELRRLFDVIEYFRTGKLILEEIQTKSDLSCVRIDQIKYQIEQNKHFRDDMEKLLGSIRRSFRERLAMADRAGVN